MLAERWNDPAALADQWATMHRETLFALHDCDVHYLNQIALGTSDDLVAHLLLKKLKLARVISNDSRVLVVRMNSLVEFETESGGRALARIAHPSAPESATAGLSISSLTGAGLIGLGEGQAILWPDRAGDLRPLKVRRIARPPASRAVKLCRKDLS